MRQKNQKSLNILGRTFIVLLYGIKRSEIRVEYPKEFFHHLLVNNPHLKGFNLELKRIYWLKKAIKENKIYSSLFCQFTSP